MRQQRHIINKQIIEIQMPKTSDAFAMQQKLGRLYREELVPVIDQQLSDCYGSDEEGRYQINELTIDLGEVTIDNIITVFAEKLSGVLSSGEVPKASKAHDEPAGEAPGPHETPLRVLSHYLMTGMLPWWAGESTKAYLLEQLEVLLKRPDHNFRELISQLRYHSVYLDRFLNTFTEAQFLRSLQLLTTIPVKGLSEMKNKLVELIRKAPGEALQNLTDLTIAKAFWAAAFDLLNTAKDYQELEGGAVRQTLHKLGVNLKNAAQWPSPIRKWTGPEKEAVHTELPAIRSLVAKLKAQHPDNRVWQQFFQHMWKVLNRSSVHLLDSRLLKALKQLLEDVEKVPDKNMQRWSPQKQAIKGTAGLKAITETRLQPLARHLHILEIAMKQMQPSHRPDIMEKLHTQFEDTDLIAVQNAGLVLLWPFLQRFFENMNLIVDKAFQSEAAKYKAACALQYLINEDEEELFEGMLLLNKVMCGISPEDTVAPILLSTEEKEIAEGLLQAVIARGPHWKNLSTAGFRASYLQREGLLGTRDGHWLLQVKKETYDVTLEKLPWGFATVKLPWMREPLMVEWI